MKVLAILAMVLMWSNISYAYNHIWYDTGAGISKIKKIVVYPIDAYAIADDYAINFNKELEKRFGIRTGGTSKGYINNMPLTKDNTLEEMLKKKVKKVHFLILKPRSQEDQLLVETNEDHLDLFQHFASEADRGRAVEEKTAADAYLVCRFRDKRIQVDRSPETATTVTLKAWTEETGGPKGNKRYNERSWPVIHVVPAKDVLLNIMDLEYTLYDTKGNKILIFQGASRNYNIGENEQFKMLTDDFVDELKQATKFKEH